MCSFLHRLVFKLYIFLSINYFYFANKPTDGSIQYLHEKYCTYDFAYLKWTLKPNSKIKIKLDRARTASASILLDIWSQFRSFSLVLSCSSSFYSVLSSHENFTAIFFTPCVVQIINSDTSFADKQFSLIPVLFCMDWWIGSTIFIKPFYILFQIQFLNFIIS